MACKKAWKSKNMTKLELIIPSPSLMISVAQRYIVSSSAEKTDASSLDNLT